MNQEIGLGAYFIQNAPPAFKPPIVNRAVNALRRRGISTMGELCALSLDDLKKVRNLGAVSLEIALQMREKFLLNHT